MENFSVNIKLECLFCQSVIFELKEDGSKPSHGELVVCDNCGNGNDFTSIYNIAIKKGKSIAIENAKSQIVKELKKTFKFK
jgi:hypothetical protein